MVTLDLYELHHILLCSCLQFHLAAGMMGSTGEFCPKCSEGYYCSHIGCASCTECTIATYTPGIGAVEASSCFSWGGGLGFGYPDQCMATWLIMLGMFLCCTCGCVVRMYRALQGTTVVIRKDELGEEREVRVVLQVDHTGRLKWNESEVSTEVSAMQVVSPESLQPGIQLEPTAVVGHTESNLMRTV